MDIEIKKLRKKEANKRYYEERKKKLNEKLTQPIPDEPIKQDEIINEIIVNDPVIKHEEEDEPLDNEKLNRFLELFEEQEKQLKEQQELIEKLISSSKEANKQIETVNDEKNEKAQPGIMQQIGVNVLNQVVTTAGSIIVPLAIGMAMKTMSSSSLNASPQPKPTQSTQSNPSQMEFSSFHGML